MAQIAAQRYTGTSVKRSEDPRILAGAGRYIDDVKLPGMLHAAFVRSPLAHGRVLAVDASAARALPGVVAVFTGADLAEMTIPGPDPLLAMMGGGGPMPEYSLLATDKVRFVGDPVAVVVAESRYLAEDGCELVEVDYEDLPAVVSAAAALDAGSPAVFANLGDNIVGPHARREHGDVAGTFAGADRVAEFHIDVHRHQNVPMEGRGVVASYDAGLRHDDRPRGDAERAHYPDGRRRVPRPGPGQGARPGRRHRRLVRTEDGRLAGGARRRGRVARGWPAGQVDRGPQREPDRVRAGARGELRRPGGRQRGRRPARA